MFDKSRWSKAIACQAKSSHSKEYNPLHRNTSLIRHQPYKWRCLISETHQSKFEAISLDQMALNLGEWINRSAKYQAFTVSISSNGKALEPGNLYVPYKWDIFISEWGDSPYRPVPYRWGITVYILYSLAKATDMGTMMIRRFHEQHHTHTHRLIMRVEHQ